MNSEERAALKIICAYTGVSLTDEQLEFASDFTKDCISFSDPGTGKTQTLISGLIMAQKYHKVPGASINCMTFTKKATSELAGRYTKACKRAGISATVNISTMHSFQLAMLKDAYAGMKPVGFEPIGEVVKALSNYMEEIGLDATDKNWVKKIYNAINTLNSSLTFHPDSVRQKYVFVQTGLNIDQFQALRKKWFVRGIIAKRIVQGDIPLYCLYALMKREDIAKKWRGRYKIMVVDEFQDLSLLHLHILSLVSETLIVVGDMKQQIYAFNGACPQIVQEYFKSHPDARVCNLTHSFRCSNAVADFATKIIYNNDHSIKPFEGHDVDSAIYIESRQNIDWNGVIDKIRIDIEKNRFGNARDVMFLYRNNASAIPVIEELYKANVPFMCTKLITIMDTPIFDKLCILANAAWQPTDIKFVTEALRLFPEFKNEVGFSIPEPVNVMRQTGKGLFDINYRYAEQSSYDILNAMAIARKKIAENKVAGVVLNNLFDVYDKYIIRGQYWRLDNTKEFYFGLVAPICNSKSYPAMYNEEIDKQAVNERCIKASVGIRCYTMHAAKGLEADDIYILDCNEGMFPNYKQYNKKVEAGCIMDAATDVRQDRNLLYVAVTRAKHNVYIIYSGESPAELIANPENNSYCEYDDSYNEMQHDYDDAGEFFKLFNVQGG